MKRSIVCGIAFGLLLASVDAGAVGTRRIGLRSADDFKGGELQGVAVDASGTVRAGFNLGKVDVPDVSSAWDALALSADRLLITTGHEGKLIELSGGSVKEAAKADAMVLTSIVKAFGTVLVGSLPGATLYEYKNGKLETWLKIEGADHIFALAYDSGARALFAATGPEGKLFRITADKKAQVFFDAEEEHLMSVALGNGRVYAGGGDEAKLYELSGPGRASVLHDFGTTEVRAIAVAKNGDLFAIANELKGRSFPSSSNSDDKKSQGPSKTKGKGTLYRFDKQGTPEQLIDDDSEYFTSLAVDAKGKPYVGTGSEGRLYTVDDQHNPVLVADTDERQINALLLDGPARHVVASDPVVAHPIRGVGGADAVWSSKVIDLGIRSRFGRLEWTATGNLALSTRSGNTKAPDDTWSPWSADMMTPGDVPSPKGRFVQVRARFNDGDATLSEVVLPFVTDNLRAVVTKVEAETPSAKNISAPDGKLEASGGPITAEPDHEVELEWDVDNPDKDPLRFRLQYQMVGTDAWFDILAPREKLTKTSYDWDTSALPEGLYRVRVDASDEIANPPETTTRHQRDSNIILVDNTPPEIQVLTAAGRRVSGTALDGVGPIARVEWSLSGSDEWIVIAPKDGLFDETSEAFDFDVSGVSPSGPALISVRVYDSENNVVVRSLTLR